MTRHHQHADFDEAWVERDALVVRGRAPQDATPRLAPRRYESPPDWIVVDIVADTTGEATAADAGPPEEFRLTCPVDGLGAASGICVAGRRHRCLVPLPVAPVPSR